MDETASSHMQRIIARPRIATSAAKAEVIEIVTLKLKPGVTASAFKPFDKAMETEYVSKQPGFISREICGWRKW